MATSNNSKFNVSAQQARQFLAEVGIYTHNREELEAGKEIWAGTVTKTSDLAQMHQLGEAMVYRLSSEPLPGIESRVFTIPGAQQIAMGTAHMLKQHWTAVGGVCVVDGKLTLIMNDEDQTQHTFESGRYGPFKFEPTFTDGVQNEYEIIKNISLVKIRGDQLVWTASVVRRDTGKLWNREFALHTKEVTETDILGATHTWTVQSVFSRTVGLSTTFKNWNFGKLISGRPDDAIALPKGWIDWLASDEGSRMMELANRSNQNSATRNEARDLIKARLEGNTPVDTQRLNRYVFGSSLTCGIMTCRGGIHLIDISDAAATLLFKLVQEAGLRVEDEGLSWWAATQQVDSGNLPFGI